MGSGRVDSRVVYRTHHIFAHCSSMEKYLGGVSPRTPRRSFSAMLKPVPLL